MNELEDDHGPLVIAHSFAPDLKEGDVALILRADGEPEIFHNIPSLAATGVLTGGKLAGAAGVMMSLAFIEIMAGDEQAFTAAMRRVTMQLEGGTLSLVQ
jgi:hypothetical protein